jgi:serine/threonine protein kinase
VERELPVGHYRGATKAGLKAYMALDNVTRQPVIVKVFPISADREIAALAESLWNRELRLTHLAASRPRGKSLLRLLDARKDKDGLGLVLVSQAGGQNLQELLDMNPRPKLLLPHDRQALWRGFLELARGLEALHSVGLLHRNISPASIYLNESEDGPLLKLGDFSWSVYLHGLESMLGTAAEKQASTRDSMPSVYVAPEARFPDRGLGEGFPSDLYSLGVIIAECVLGELPKGSVDPKKWFESVQKLIQGSGNLDPLEAVLLLRLLDPVAGSRPADAADVAESIASFLPRLERDLPTVVHDPMTVVFDSRPESKMWKDLARWVNIDGLAQRFDAFLSEEFANARVYAYTEGRAGLWLQGRSGAPYNLQPYFSKRDQKENLSVASLWPMPFTPATATDGPMLTLAAGVSQTSYGWNTAEGPSWAPYFLRARKLLEKGTPRSPQGDLVQRLRITLEAERQLMARHMYPYRLTAPPSADARREVAVIEVDAKEPHPRYGSINRPSLEAWYRLQFGEGRLEVELSENASPLAPLSPDRRWRITKLKDRNRLVLERRGGGENPPQTGWLKPWDFTYQRPLLNRKQRIVDLVEEDDYLLQALVDPALTTIVVDAGTPVDLVGHIVGTRPLFLIQGPPGTGKTYWASQVIRRLLEEDAAARVLVSSQAHKPLDHLYNESRKAVSSATVYPAPVFVRLAKKEGAADLEGRPEVEELGEAAREILLRASEWKPEFVEWAEIGQKWRALASEQLEATSPAWEDLIRGSANVVFVTSTSSALRDLEGAPPFDFVLIEEAGKAYATELLPPLRLGRRWLLIGDQQQLPPFQHKEMTAAARGILARDESFQQMDETQQAEMARSLDQDLRFFAALFDRVKTAQYPYRHPGRGPPAVRLNEQRRMPALLSEMISTVFYDARFELRTGDRPLPFAKPQFLATSPLVWINTPHAAGAHRRAEESPGREGGYFNQFEASTTKLLLGRLAPRLESDPGSLVVLSPYTAQVAQLQRTLKGAFVNLPGFDPSRDIHTVDSFQGRQAPVAIVSLVRNNDLEQPFAALGFLTLDERMNVLLSRASHQLVIVGSLSMLETFKTQPEAAALRQIAKFVRDRGVVVPSSALRGEDSS